MNELSTLHLFAADCDHRCIDATLNGVFLPLTVAKVSWGWFRLLTLLTLAPFGKEFVAANNNFNSPAIANVALAIKSVDDNAADDDDDDLKDDGWQIFRYGIEDPEKENLSVFLDISLAPAQSVRPLNDDTANSYVK